MHHLLSYDLRPRPLTNTDAPMFHRPAAAAHYLMSSDLPSSFCPRPSRLQTRIHQCSADQMPPPLPHIASCPPLTIFLINIYRCCSFSLPPRDIYCPQTLFLTNTSPRCFTTSSRANTSPSLHGPYAVAHAYRHKSSHSATLPTNCYTGHTPVPPSYTNRNFLYSLVRTPHASPASPLTD